MIVEDASDRERSLETLGEVCLKTCWQLHAYWLMGNHLPVPSTSDRFSSRAGSTPSQSRGWNAMVHYGEEIEQSAEQKARRIIAEELAKMGCKESDLGRRRKGEVRKKEGCNEPPIAVVTGINW